MEKETRLKRILFRCTHRGTKESDMLMGPYASRYLSTMDAPSLDAFEALLAESDSDIWDWISEAATTPERYTPFIVAMRTLYSSSEQP